MQTDFCVIGGGIAGLSVACRLGKKAGVTVLEMEKNLAYHTTGRSAALYSELFTAGTARALTRLSRPFLLAPGGAAGQFAINREIGCIFTATREEKNRVKTCLETFKGVQALDVGQMLDRVPVLRTGRPYIESGLLEENAFKIDVAALVDRYRRQIMSRGSKIICGAEVTSITPENGGWRVQAGKEIAIRARKIINAAGAWGDVIAGMAGIRPLGLTPLRRSIIIFNGPDNVDVSNWPAVGGINGGYYFMPEAGRLIGSAADEVPSPPCDAQPGEYDVALAAGNIESNTHLEIDRIHGRWAGLRTFSPDRQIVAGYDPANPDFFWLVGQGGVGIQTAPAVARAAAGIALGEPLPAEFEAAGITTASLSPHRFT